MTPRRSAILRVYGCFARAYPVDFRARFASNLEDEHVSTLDSEVTILE